VCWIVQADYWLLLDNYFVRVAGYRPPPQKLVRSDQNARTLDGMFALQEVSRPTPSRERNEEADMSEVIDIDGEDDTGPAAKRRKSGVVLATPSSTVTSDPGPSQRKKIPTVACKLTSVSQLRNEVKEATHAGQSVACGCFLYKNLYESDTFGAEIEQIIKNHVFVACVDVASNLSLIQHGTKLYLVNHASFT
jgi:DNA mismatch repair protein MLH1